jgi:DNA (cytosine-5)-methyltransferase 1
MGTIIPFRGRPQGRYTALEFFAGIGLARAGLERHGIETVWANDIDALKCRMYEQEWGGAGLLQADVFSLRPEGLPQADVAWSSSPCTDLSLAGTRHGLISGRESSAFFGFTQAIRGMGEHRPEVLVLENVVGLASSHNGDDLRAAAREFNDLGYCVDAITLDARRWLPQSRPRLFMIGALHPLEGGVEDTVLRPDWLSWIHSDPSIVTNLTPLPSPPSLLEGGLLPLLDPIDDESAEWWDAERSSRFVDSLSASQRERFATFRDASSLSAHTAYRRTRNGTPTWEMRADDIAGCLRTARGGSSRQAVVFAGRGQARMRWMTGAEYARLMGMPDFATDNLSDAQLRYGFGDAVAVPAVSWLAENMIIPVLAHAYESGEALLHA